MPEECTACTLFPNSRLVTQEWGAQINNWVGNAGQVWALCCSTFDGCDTGALFHEHCDARTTPTVTVARNAGGTSNCGNAGCGTNPGGYIFGGYVSLPLLVL